MSVALKTTQLNFDSISFNEILPAIDIIGVRVVSHRCSLYIIVIYIPPNTPVKSYENLFDLLLSLPFMFSDNNILILGDFNLTNYVSFLLTGETDNKILALINFLNILNLTQFNCTQNTHGRTLDLVIHDKLCSVEKSVDPWVTEDEHHPALHISIQMNISKNFKNNGLTVSSSFYNFRKANFPLLYDKLLNTDWSALKLYNNVEDACSSFYAILNTTFESCVPKFKQNKIKKYPPWFSYGIIREIKLKAQKLKEYRNTKDIISLNEFRRLRSKIKTDIDIAYRNYIASTENRIREDPAKFWAFLNKKKGLTNMADVMNYNGTELNEPIEILNAFADYFSKSYAPSSDHLDSTSQGACNNSNVTEFTEDEVLKALKKIKNKMTTGPDGVPAFLLKDCACLFAPPLTIIFNLIIKNASFPAMWQRSKVCPIFKKGDKSDISNFRAISIICNFAKVLEILLHEIIYNDVNKKISIHQHGFMKGRSTTTNLLCVTQYICEILDDQSQADVVYTDFSKAFDRLDHKMLLNKLENIGLPDNIVCLFRSYLSNRIQYVVFNGFKSAEYLATSGVPQGSILGPLLFVIFINDIIEESDNFKFLMYADDLKLFSRIDSMDDCILLQAKLDKVSNWCTKYKLPLNPQKCNVMSYTRKSCTLTYNYNINNNVLPRPETFRDLGVIFDKTISFQNHISTIISQASKLYGFIVRNSRDFSNVDTLKMLYFCFIRSKLEYASLVWAPHHNVHVNNLESVQRKFLKFLYFRSEGIYPAFGFPQQDLLDKYSLNSLGRRRECASQVFLVKLINNNIDAQDLLSKLLFNIPRIASRYNNVFYLATPRTDILKFSPIYIMCSYHNAICHEIDIFNCSLNAMKAHFIKQ